VPRRALGIYAKLLKFFLNPGPFLDKVAQHRPSGGNGAGAVDALLERGRRVPLAQHRLRSLSLSLFFSLAPSLSACWLRSFLTVQMFDGLLKCLFPTRQGGENLY